MPGEPPVRTLGRPLERGVLLLGSILLLACEPSPPPPAGPAAAPRAATSPAHGTTATPPEKAPLDFVELLTGGASQQDDLPLIVAIHGLGDNPGAFSGVMRGFSRRARVLAPAGPSPHGSGFSWFPYRPGRSDAELSAGIRAAADRLAQFLRWAARARPTVGRPIVTGFSQGGMLSFALAVEHPDLVAGAYPMGGMLPRGLWPDATASFPPIVAFHGDADPVVSFDADRATVERLRQLGAHAELRSYAGVRHAVPSPMRRDLFGALGDAVSRLQR